MRVRKQAVISKHMALIVSMALALSLGCRGSSSKQPTITSVLLITVDSLRADHLGCYGNASVSTPAMDGLAASGVRFARAYANDVLSLPSHASLLSGTYPFVHGVRDRSGFRMPDEIDTAATLFRARAFACGAFVGGSPMDSRYGLDRGFDLYDDSYGDATQVQEFKLVERRAEAVAAPFLQWLDARPPASKWFAWVHFYDPHAPYAPAEPYRSKFASSPYDGEIASVDAQVARVLARLEQKGWKESTCVILTSDHGEGLGEHSETTHGVFAYESTIRVPLIVTGPGIAPRTVQTAAQHIDLLPTMLDLTGAPVPATLKGMSLKPLLYGGPEESKPRDIYFESVGASLSGKWAPLTGIVSGNYKYIELPIPELYEVARDPGEKENLCEKKPEVAAALKKRLSALASAAAPAESSNADQEELDRLASLGYVSSGGGETATESTTAHAAADDPKNLIDVESRLAEGVEAARSGDLPRAQRVFAEIIAKRPGMGVAYADLATVYRQMGQPKKGIEILERALKERHGTPGMLTKLGLCFSEAGQTARAIQVLEEATRESGDNVDAFTYLGLAYAKAGQPGLAVAAFEKILAGDPNNASALTHIGRIRLEQKDYPGASESFNKALQADPRFAPALASLGDAMNDTGNSDGAISNWRRAIELDPTQYDTLYKLASLYVRLDRAADARPYVEQFVRTAPPVRYKREIEQLQKASQKRS